MKTITNELPHYTPSEHNAVTEIELGSCLQISGTEHIDFNDLELIPIACELNEIMYK